MSTISTVVGMTFSGFTREANRSNRESGTLTTPILGSIVQKGKFALCALAFDKQLNKVDLPTLGNPTIPAFINYSSWCKKRCLASNLNSVSTWDSSGTQQSTGHTAAHCGSS